MEHVRLIRTFALLPLMLLSCGGPECGFSQMQHTCTANEAASAVTLDSVTFDSVLAKVTYRCGEEDIYGTGYCYDPLSAPESMRQSLWILESHWTQFPGLDNYSLHLSTFVTFHVDQQRWPEPGKVWDLPAAGVQAPFELQVDGLAGSATVLYDLVSCRVTTVAASPEGYSFTLDDIHLVLSEDNDAESLARFELTKPVPSEITVPSLTGGCDVETFNQGC